MKFRFPEPPHCGKAVLIGGGPREGLRRPAGVRRRLVRRRTRRAPAHHGPERRGQDEPAADPRRAVRGRSRARSGSGTASTPGYYAQEHEGILDGMPTCSTTCGRRRGADDQALRALLGMFGLSGDDRVPGRGHALRRREDEARAGAARGGAEEPAAARRADEQPRSAVAHRDRRGARRTGRARWSSSATTPSSCEALAPQRVLMMPDGDARLLERGPAGPRGAGLTRRIGVSPRPLERADASESGE